MSTRRVVWVALGAGAVLRLVYLLWARELPFFSSPITDALYHHRWAEAIANGVIWDGRPFFRAPFYPYTLGFLYALVGAHIWVGKIFGHLIGLATGGLIITLAGRLFGRREAILAAALWLGSGLLLFFEGELLLDSGFTFLVILATFLLLGNRPKMQRIWISGTVLGLAAITRPTALILLPAYLFWLWLECAPTRTRAVAVWLLGCMIPVAVIAGLNSYALGRPAGIAMQGGINFYVGNNSSADGYTAVLPAPWGYAWSYDQLSQHAAQVHGRKLDAAEVSSFYYARGLRFVRDDPGRFLSLLIKKAVLSINRVTISNNLNLPYVQDALPLLKWLPVRVAWLVPLALAGLLYRGAAPRARRFIWLCVLLYTGVLMLFFTTERFRLPLAPCWILLAAYGGASLLSGSRVRRAAAVGMIAAGLLMTFPNWYHLKPENQALAYFNLGNVALRGGDNRRAALMYDSAAVFTDDLHQLRLNRGLAHLRSGQLEAARSDFEAEAESFPFDARPFNNLAALFLLTGDTVQAERALDSGLARDSALGLLYLQRLAIAAQRADTAVMHATLVAAERNAGAWPVWSWWRGEYAQLSGRPDRARSMYRTFTRAQRGWPSLDGNDLVYAGPAPAEAIYRIGLTFLEEGVLDSAEAQFARAAEADSGFAAAWANWGTAALARGDTGMALVRYRRAVGADPGSPLLWTNLSWAHVEAGNLDSALKAVVNALAIDSTFPPARALAEQLQRPR
jgi:tetratricopeptide (TPR) repeat protein